jgi:hypothetical protein
MPAQPPRKAPRTADTEPGVLEPEAEGGRRWVQAQFPKKIKAVEPPVVQFESPIVTFLGFSRTFREGRRSG